MPRREIKYCYSENELQEGSIPCSRDGGLGGQYGRNLPGWETRGPWWWCFVPPTQLHGEASDNSQPAVQTLPTTRSHPTDPSTNPPSRGLPCRDADSSRCSGPRRVCSNHHHHHHHPHHYHNNNKCPSQSSPPPRSPPPAPSSAASHPADRNTAIEMTGKSPTARTSAPPSLGGGGGGTASFCRHRWRGIRR